MKNSRGFCGIGVYHPKHEHNIGGLFRSAQNMGASFMFTIGRRYNRQASDTGASFRHIPLFHFNDFWDFNEHRPFGSQLVAIELAENSISLPEFVHPTSATYLLGAEDHGLPKELLDHCQYIVQIPTDRCINVASAGTCVLYDRMVKGMR